MKQPKQRYLQKTTGKRFTLVSIIDGLAKLVPFHGQPKYAVDTELNNRDVWEPIP